MRAWPNTQNHCKVLRSRTRKSHHLPRIFTTRTPFSPTRMPKRWKGCHFARTTERPRAKTTTSRQRAPRPPPPDASFSFRKPTLWPLGQIAAPAPSPLCPIYTSILTILILTKDEAHARPRGGGGLPLPAAAAAAPEKTSAQGGSAIEKNDIKKTKRERDRKTRNR